MPAKVDELFDEVKSTNPDYTDEQAWATAWSIYCKHVEPGSDSCHLPTSEYLSGKTASTKLVEEVSDGGRTAYIFEDGGSLIVQMNYRGDKEEQTARNLADARKKAKAMLESVAKYASGPDKTADHYDDVVREQKERELKSILKRTGEALQAARELNGALTFSGLPDREKKKAQDLLHEVVTILEINRGRTRGQLEELEDTGDRTAATAERVAARFLRADRKDDEKEWKEINAEIMEYQRVLKIYEKMLADLDAQTKDIPAGGLEDWRGLRSGVLHNIADTKAEIKKLSDHLSHSYLLKSVSRSRGR